jgi:hypothetical protein
MKEEKFTPAELLETAEELFKMGNSKMYRAAILEAITALESYVATEVTEKLEDIVGKEFAKWLEEKTRFDFDSRLGVLTSFVTGVEIDKDGKLWGDYKKSKEIRNKVTHSGKKVTKEQGRFIIDVTYEWVDFLNQAQKIGRKDKATNKSAYDLLGQFVQVSARLEKVIYSALMKFEPGKIDPRLAFRVEELSRLGLADDNTLAQLRKFREMRNRAVHSHPDEAIKISQADVVNFNNLVDIIEKKLEA